MFGFSLPDVVVAAITLLDVLCGGVLCIALGYRLMPAALGLLTGGVGSLLTGSVTPVYFQQESMVQASQMGKDIPSRMSMILGAAVLTGILGLLGLPQLIVDRVGPEIFAAVLCGVGLFLTKVAVWDLSWKMNRLIGFTTIAVAVIVQLITNDLILAIVASVPLGVLMQWVLVRMGRASYEEVKMPSYKSWGEAFRTEFQPVRLTFSRAVLIGALSLSVLTVGANIAYTAVNLSMTTGAAPTYNQVTVISSIADFGSSLFGGPSMEVVISATAAAPHPVASGALLMFAATAIILTGAFAYRIARRVPPSGMAGYLVAIGALLVALPNGQQAFQTGNPVIMVATIAVTAIFNPFWGLLTGVVLKFLLSAIGVL